MADGKSIFGAWPEQESEGGGGGFGPPHTAYIAFPCSASEAFSGEVEGGMNATRPYVAGWTCPATFAV